MSVPVVNATTVKGIYAHCEDEGGWIFGHLIDGMQAEYLRVPMQITLFTILQKTCQMKPWLCYQTFYLPDMRLVS